jgi:molybdate transport system substrate-binding protein
MMFATRIVLAAALLAAPAAAAESLRVAAAISLKDALSQIAKEYEAQTGTHVELTFGSSGQLAAQIKSGAPIDLFISAANQQVDELARDGLIDHATRRPIIGNKLVLIVPADNLASVNSFESLADASVTKVALGEPRSVPAGQYAQQALKSLDLLEKIKNKLVYGSNVRQVLAYVERGEVSAGIVYATDAQEAAGKVAVVAIAEDSTHEPIVYPGAVVKASDRKDTAKKFLEYLCGAEGRAVFESKGFTPAQPEK